MSKIVALLVLFLVWEICVWDCSAVANDGILYPFPLNTLLTCHVPNPFAGKPGEEDSIPEDTPRLQLQAPTTPGQLVWTPVSSGFRRPQFEDLNTELLLNFVGSDINIQVQSVTTPTNVPPNAFEIIPRQGVGSGGNELGFFVTDAPPTPPQIGLDPADRAIVENYVTNVGLGNCPLVSNWTLLPDTFFPRWYSAGFCNRRPCSFPEGLTCEPDIGEDRLVYITALRWDCCWNFMQKQWRWDCGWRKVQIPIVIDCHCGCDVRLRMFP